MAFRKVDAGAGAIVQLMTPNARELVRLSFWGGYWSFWVKMYPDAVWAPAGLSIGMP